jgi:hypothetical protein
MNSFWKRLTKVETVLGGFFAVVAMAGYSYATVGCNDSRCLETATNALGQCTCVRMVPGTEPATTGIYLNDYGDRITVVNGEVSVQEMGIDLSKINNTRKALIISLSGAGVSGKRPLLSKPMETLLLGEQPSSQSDCGDMIYKRAANFLDQQTVAVVGFPWLYAGAPSSSFDDAWWGPEPSAFASRIGEALARMAGDRKLILIGKSLGGCKLSKVVGYLHSSNITVDLLILVDPSCSMSDQRDEVHPIPDNVKNVVDFRQETDHDHNDGQNGFGIRWSSPTMGADIVVNSGLCDAVVGHNSIDECPLLLETIDSLVVNELAGRNLSYFFGRYPFREVRQGFRVTLSEQSSSYFPEAKDRIPSASLCGYQEPRAFLQSSTPTGKARIDWGDGTIDEVNVHLDLGCLIDRSCTYTKFAHLYRKAANYTVRVSYELSQQVRYLPYYVPYYDYVTSYCLAWQEQTSNMVKISDLTPVLGLLLGD